MRATRETGGSLLVVELCVDDEWLGYPFETLPTMLPPQNLQLESREDALFFSWEAPPTEDEIRGYSVVCSTNIQIGSGQPIALLTLSVNTSDLSVSIPFLMEESTDYSCCATAQYEGGASSSSVCGTVLSGPAPTPTETSDSILVPVLGVLAALFFLALVVVSVALLVFMCTGVKQKHGSHVLADIAELERKE